LDWHPKENVVALGMTGSELYLLDFDTGEKETIGGVEGWSRGIGWNRNGKLLAAGDGEGVIHIWNRKGEKVTTINKGDTKSYVGLTWHPRKNQLIGIAQYVRRYNHRGKLLELTQHREEAVLLLCLQWHPSGDFYALGDYGDGENKAVLQFWEDDGTDLQEFWGSEGPYRNLRWSPDGNMLATASDALRIWSEKGELLFTGASPDLLWGVDWSPDQQYIITSSDTGLVKLWDNEGKLVKDLER
jgi:WD40 repeat protein